MRAAPLDLRGFAIFHEPLEARRKAYAELARHIISAQITVDVELIPLSDIATACERQRAGAHTKLVTTP